MTYFLTVDRSFLSHFSEVDHTENISITHSNSPRGRSCKVLFREGDHNVASLSLVFRIYRRGFEFRMAHLQRRDGDEYLHPSIRKVEADEETPEPDSRHGTVLGVELGVTNLAVASTGQFWSADEFNHRHQEEEKRRGSLQQCGSRHAHENIETIGQKEYGRFEIRLHTVANELFEEAVGNDCSHIVFRA